mgnify:CR=1 FL=1
MLTTDAYHMPATLAQALTLLAEAPAGSRLVAGATDLLPWAREGRAGDVHLPALIDVTRIDEMSGVSIANGRVRFGANTVYQAFMTEPALARALPVMPHCAIWFADDQIREQATLAGNVVNASPAADGTPPLVAMNAVIECARRDATGTIVRRAVPIAEFLLGPGRTMLADGEIVTAITCDDMTGYGGAFEKVGQRRSLVIAVVNAAALVRTDRTGTRFEDVRLAIGGIGPVPLRLAEAEAMLRGQPVSAELIARASRLADDRIASRSRREYRRTVTRGFIAAVLENALADCGVPLLAARHTETADV